MNIYIKTYLLVAFAVFGLVGGFFIIESGAFVALADNSSSSVTVGNAAPTVTNVSISPDPISLTESTTTLVTVTATISDGNGCQSVFSSGTISAVLFRSGVAATSSCTADDLNCYVSITLANAGGDTCDGGSDTTADASGTVPVFWFADATDASSTFSAEYWDSAVTATDESGSSSVASASDNAPTGTSTINTLTALNVTATINYGTFAANSSSSAAQNQTATTTNTGNSEIDIEFSGTDMVDGVETLVVTNQRYGTSTADHANLSFQLTTSATTRQINLAKATASSTDSETSTFWGINIPNGQAPGNYSGTNTFTALWSN